MMSSSIDDPLGGCRFHPITRPPLLAQQSAQTPSLVVFVTRPQFRQSDSGASRS